MTPVCLVPCPQGDEPCVAGQRGAPGGPVCVGPLAGGARAGLPGAAA